MSTTYAGDETNFPTDVTLPSDGDPKDASSINVPLEGLADRTAWLKDHIPQVGFHSETGLAFLTTSATYVDVTGLFVTLSDCKIGDKLVMSLEAQVAIGTAGFEGSMALVVNDGSDHVLIEAPSSQLVASGSACPTVIQYVFTVSIAVNHTVKAQAKCDGTHAVTVSSPPATVTVIKVRPES